MSEPIFFYKFVSFDRKDILQNGLIRFSPIGSFNDPFELEPSVTPLSRKFIEYASKLSETEIHKINFTKEDIEYSLERAHEIDNYKEKYRNEIGKYGVLSLSSNNKINQLLAVCIPEKKDPRTNILMWSHYADSHQGFVIEFRADFIENIKLKKVQYSDERKYLTYEDIIESKFDDVFYKKSMEWAYEKEYRAILPLDRAEEVKNGTYHLFKINKGSINSITFGCAMSKKNKAAIVEIINNDNEFKNVQFNHAYLNDDDFLLNFYYDDGEFTNDPSHIGATRIPSQKKF